MLQKKRRPAFAQSFFASVLVGTAIVMIAACQSTSSAAQYAARTADAAPEPEPRDSGACATCVEARCALPRAQCAANAVCASALSGGRPGPGDAADDREGRDLYTALTDCEDEATRACETCPATEPTFTDPVLKQACQDASVRMDDDGGGLTACDMCLDLKCCDSSAKYFSFDDRGAYRDCVDPCLNLSGTERQACKQGCYANHPRALVEGNLERATCALYRCPTECKVAKNCINRCSRQYCANEVAACLANIECNLLFDCIDGCKSDVQCVDACYAQFPTSRATFAPFTACLVAHCSACN
jgi:hypothetical protein